jgi:acyl-coenzyme A thioesterase PaaI-like protein
MASGARGDPAPAAGRISHHDLCFGCGLANPFGLGLELFREGQSGVAGRFFVKQDHQGADGRAHPGILAAALTEAMSHVVDGGAAVATAKVEIEIRGEGVVGTYLTVAADVEGQGHALTARASLRDPEDVLVAEGRATFVPATVRSERA